MGTCGFGRSSPAGRRLPPLETAPQLLRNCKEKKGYEEPALRTLGLQVPDLKSHEPVLNCLLVRNSNQVEVQGQGQLCFGGIPAKEKIVALFDWVEDDHVTPSGPIKINSGIFVGGIHFKRQPLTKYP